MKTCVRVRLGSLSLDGLKTSYADAPAGGALALIDGSRFLEIAISHRTAARGFGIEVGDAIVVQLT